MSSRQLHTSLNLPSQELTLLRGCNDPPRDTLRHVLCDELSRAQLTSKALENEVTPHNAVHDAESEQRRAFLLDTISTLSHILAPIRLLPVEILEKCFILYGQEGRGIRLHGDAYSVSCGPWDLTHVCRKWRDVAVACPFLWTTVDIKVHVDVGSEMPLVRDAFLRSRSLPITLILSYQCRCTTALFLPSIIYPQCPRIEELTFRMLDNSNQVLTSQPLPFSEMRLLKSLELHIFHILVDQRAVMGSIVFPPDKSLGAPCLTSLKITFPLDPARLSVPWQQLTCLSVHDSNELQIHSIISICPNLIYLRAMARKFRSCDDPSSVIIHDKLEEWIMFSPNIFGSIKMPNLKRLTVGPNATYHDQLHRQLVHLLSASQPPPLVDDIPQVGNLESLHLKSADIGQGVLTTFFSLHTLRSLTFSFYVYDDIFLSDLINLLSSKNATFLPNLHSLVFRFDDGPGAKLEALPFLNRQFLTMIRSRQETLRCVGVHTFFWDGKRPAVFFDTEDLEELRVLKSKGFQLDISALQSI